MTFWSGLYPQSPRQRMAANLRDVFTRFNRRGREDRRVKKLAQLAGAILIAVLVSAGSKAGPMVILAGNSNTSSFSDCVGTPASTCGSNTGTSLPLSSFTLNINPVPFSATGNTTGLDLAELNLTAGNNPAGTATFKYNLMLDFTTPSGIPSTSDTLDLTMSSMGNGINSTETFSGFMLTLTDPLVLPGVTLSNFHFVNTNNGTSGSFSNGVWTVTRGPGMPGSTSSTLDLVADVAAAAPIPEPSSFAVLGVALAGLVLVRRRRDYAV